MAFPTVDIQAKKILITGPTGQVAEPVVAAWAQQADVYALARFSKEEDRQRIEALGAHCLQADLADPHSLKDIPDDFDYVLNFAVVKSGDFDYDLAANAEGLGRLMLHCRNVKSFLHLSSTAVYEYTGQELRAENSPLGDNHRDMFPTYSISKIAAETVCRFVAREFGIPTTIARLCVPYGDNGGWPFYHLLMMENGIPIDLHPDKPNYYNLLHVDDYLEKLPSLLAVASKDATTVNFGGSDQVSIEQWCALLTELTGFEPIYQDNPKAFGSQAINTERMHALIGRTSVPWQEGVERMVRALAPEKIKQ
jgi:UDP-glucuronate 4-epimerase